MSAEAIKKRVGMPTSNVASAAEIFSEYGDFIRATIRYNVKDDAWANDMFQDFFLSLVSNPVPAGVKNIRTYLYSVIVNDIVDATRRVEKYKTRMNKYAECLNYSINKNAPKNILSEVKETNKMFNLIEGWLRCSEVQAITLGYRDSYIIKEAARKTHGDIETVGRYISAGLSKIRQFLQSGREESCEIYGSPELAEEINERPKAFYEGISVELEEDVFRKIYEDVIELENASDDKAKILYYFMEAETSLGELEERARVVNRKYEGRLSASLRDICRVHDPKNISEEQIKCLTASIRTLLKGWGKLNRKKVSWIRSRLLEVGLTWLPITDKAAKDITEPLAQ